MGAKGLIVKVTDTEHNVHSEYTFERSPVRIGRSPLNDLPLERSFVSHCHGVLQFDQNRCEFVDLGSTNGTFVGEQRLLRNAPRRVDDGTTLTIGSLQLQVRLGDARRAPDTRSSYAFRRSEINVAVGVYASTRPDPRHVTPAITPGVAHAHEGPSQPLAAVARPQAMAAQRDHELTALYAQYRSSWRALLAALVQRAPLGSERDEFVSSLLGDFPELAQEAEFRRWVEARPPARDPTADPRPSARERNVSETRRATAGLGALAEAIQRASGLEVPPELESPMLDRTFDILDHFARAFFELRRGQRQLTRDLSLPTGEALLADAQDARSLLAYLLDPDAAGRLDELSRAYADLMLHQIAFLNAVTAGARELLNELSPDSLAKKAGSSLLGWLGRIVGYDARWAALGRRVEDLREETALASVLFGRGFVRAYAAAIGRAGEARGDEPRANDFSGQTGKI